MNPSDMFNRTFYPFQRLPAEIRASIWEMTVEPRTVKLCCIHTYPTFSNDLKRRFSPTPAPPMLHSCQEARDQLRKFYQQFFFNQAIHIRAPSTQEEQQQYVWLNWEIDVISIGKSPLLCFEPIAPLVRRLQLERDAQDEHWFHFESKELRNFTAVTEIYAVCSDHDFREWHGTSEDLSWPCGRENVFVVDGALTIKLLELEDICDRELEELYLKEDPNGQYKLKNGYPC